MDVNAELDLELENQLAIVCVDDLVNHCAQYPLTLKFKLPHIERAYKLHHFKAFSPRLRIVARSFWILTALCTASVVFKWAWFPLYHFLRTDDGDELSIVDFLPLVCLTGISSYLLSEELHPCAYQRVIALCTIGFVFVFTELGVLLRASVGLG